MSGINRIIKQTDHQYTMVPNQAVRDKDITSNAFRLLAYLLSHENGYELVYSQIIRQTDLGKYAIQKAIQRLTDKGLLKVEETRRKDGSFGGYNYILLDPYKTEANEPESGQSATDSFRIGSTSPLKEDKQTKKITNKENKSLSETELPNDWKPNQQLMEMFATKWPDIDPDYHIEQFKLYYLSKSTKHKDWSLTFQRWMNSEQSKSLTQPWRAGAGNSTASKSRKQSELKASDEYLAELREREKLAAPAPKCPHGENVALCRSCL